MRLFVDHIERMQPNNTLSTTEFGFSKTLEEDYVRGNHLSTTGNNSINERAS